MNHLVYDPNGNVLPRYVLARDNSLICVDTYDLDDPSVPWTPIDDTEYKINQERQVLEVETEQAGYVWVKFKSSKLWCIAMLETENINDLDHRNQCFGGKECCSECGQLWKLYEQHQSKCWPCIIRTRENGLVVRCNKSSHFCRFNDCLNCFRRSLAFYERSLFRPVDSEKDNPSIHIGKSSDKKIDFTCCECGHDFDTASKKISIGRWCPYCSSRKRCTDEDCIHCFTRSMASHLRTKNWSSRNKVSPRQIALNSKVKYWFDCNVCKHDFDATPRNVNAGKWCPYCSNKRRCGNPECTICHNHSVASHPKSHCWSAKNKVSASTVALNDNRYYLFDCDTCKHEFDMSPNCMMADNWCPYCANRKRCEDPTCKLCHDHSVASHPKGGKFWSKKNPVTARSVARCSSDTYLFDCEICKHYFTASPRNVTQGDWCSYCSNSKRCGDVNCKVCFLHSIASHPNGGKYWSSKNPVSALTVALHAQCNYIFDCDVCGNDFQATPDNVCRGSWCPRCRNKTELKLLTWLQTTFPTLTIVPQARFQWSRNPATNKQLPFDFYIPDLNLIIELDGGQHFIHVSNWSCPEYVQWFDVYKMSRTQDQGITIVRIIQDDVWRDLYDWQSALSSSLVVRTIPIRVLLDNGTGTYQKFSYDTQYLEVTNTPPSNIQEEQD